MKSLIPVILIATVFGAASGAVGSLLFREADGTGPDVASSSSAPLLPDPQTIKQLASLREENLALRERVTSLENRPAPVVTAPFSMDETRAELDALAKKVDQLNESPTGKAARSSGEALEASALPEFSAAVEKTLQGIRKREQANRWRGGTKKAMERVDDRLTKIQAQLDLTPVQVDQMRNALLAEGERNLELIRLWEEGNSSEEALGEVKTNNRRAHQDALSTILTPTQFQQYGSRGDKK